MPACPRRGRKQRHQSEKQRVGLTLHADRVPLDRQQEPKRNFYAASTGLCADLRTRRKASPCGGGLLVGWLARNPEPKPGEQQRQQPQERQQQQPQERKGRDRFIPAARPWYEKNKGWYDNADMTVERAAVQGLRLGLARSAGPAPA